MDLELLRLAQAWQPDWLTELFRIISILSDTPSYFFIVPLVAAVMLRRGRSRLALATLLAVSGNILNPLIKSIVERPRPTMDVARILDLANGSSFPSGHALGAMLFYGFLAMVLWTKGTRWGAFVLGGIVVVVGISRVYLGAHWPSDVLAGYVIGLVWIMTVRWLVPRR